MVNALLIEGDTLSVNISMAEKLDTNRLGFVDNARVELFVNDTFVEELQYTENGEYKSTTFIEANQKYTCKVFVPGFDTIICEQLTPDIPRILDIKHINIAGKDEEGVSFPAIELTFENNFKNKDYYEIEINYIQIFRDTSYSRVSSLKTIVDPVLLNEGLPLALFNNVLISDSVYTMNINYSNNVSYSIGGSHRRAGLYPIVVELRKVTEDYYRFKKQLYLYESGLWADGVLTSMTNNNIYSNIENAYGIFIAYSATVSDTITPNLDGYYD